MVGFLLTLNYDARNYKLKKKKDPLHDIKAITSALKEISVITLLLICRIYVN